MDGDTLYNVAIAFLYLMRAAEFAYILASLAIRGRWWAIGALLGGSFAFIGIFALPVVLATVPLFPFAGAVAVGWQVGLYALLAPVRNLLFMVPVLIAQNKDFKQLLQEQKIKRAKSKLVSNRRLEKEHKEDLSELIPLKSAAFGLGVAGLIETGIVFALVSIGLAGVWSFVIGFFASILLGTIIAGLVSDNSRNKQEQNTLKENEDTPDRSMRMHLFRDFDDTDAYHDSEYTHSRIKALLQEESTSNRANKKSPQKVITKETQEITPETSYANARA